jgi:hypothetical protein
MRKARLLSTVAATLLLTAGAVSAQGVKKDEAPTPAPAAQQNAPAMKPGSPSSESKQSSESKKLPATTGQASDADKSRANGAMEKGGVDKSNDKSMDKKLDKSSDKASEKSMKKDSDANGTTNTKVKENTAQGASDKKSTETKTERDSTTGQGAAGSAKLSTEQRTKITTIFKQKRVEPAHLNITIRVGTRVPDSVRFYPVPEEVVVIYPEWRGYDYIMVGNDILVIDRRTHEIVAILEA